MNKTTVNSSNSVSLNRIDQKNSNITTNTILETEFEQSDNNFLNNNSNNGLMSNKQTESIENLVQNDWIRDELKKLWGETEAEYFSNPNVIQRENRNNSNTNFSTNINNINESSGKNNNSKLNQNLGLFAYDIWDSLRDDTNNCLKNFDLNKELQETMNSSINRKKIDSSSSNNEQIHHSSQEKEINKNKGRLFDMNEIKRAKIFRNEIELMYRSSKMNQEKVNLLRNSNPNSTNGGEFGLIESERDKNSVVNYLPPMSFGYENRTHKMNSSLEFFSSPKMRQKYKKELEKKLSISRSVTENNNNNNYQNSNLSLVEFKKHGVNHLKKDPVKLEFLTEKPFRSYLSSNREHHLSNNKAGHFNNLNQSLMPVSNEELETTHNNHTNMENKIRSLVLFDDNNKSSEVTKNESNQKNSQMVYPPLSMNALMEYKPSLVAPGVGEFDHGRPKFFRKDIK